MSTKKTQTPKKLKIQPNFEILHMGHGTLKNAKTSTKIGKLDIWHGCQM
jgi:hypothetical protein